MDRKTIEDIYPLSPLQHGILFHALLSAEGGLYVEQFPLLLEGPLDVDALEAAFRGVAARHPALRTAFAWENVPQPLQVVFRAEAAALVCDRADWPDAPDDGWRARLDRWMETDRRRGLDLKRAPLMRVTTIRLAPARHVLVLTCHHAVVDGWSMQRLWADWGALYDAHRLGRPAALPPAPRFREYVAWVAKQDAAASEAFWRASLAGVRGPTPLPLDRGGAAVTDAYAEEELAASPELARRVEAFARGCAVTAGTVIMGAWALLLARWAGEEDVVFGTTVSGRPAELSGVDGMVGLFINTLPVRVSLPPEARLGDWLAALQRHGAELRAHGHARLTDVHGWSQVPRDRPLFESLLVFENYPLGGGDDGDAEMRVVPLKVAERTNYPLLLVAMPFAGELGLRLTYDPRRFSAKAARTLLTGLLTLLDAMGAGPDQRLGALSPLGSDEARKIDAWGRGSIRSDAPALVHRLVEHRASIGPDAVAVEWDAATLTYAELNARANRLARRLRAVGVESDDVVAVSMERSAELAVALLAAVKAGGAFLAVDPAYPPERRAFMLADSGARAVLTTSDLASDPPSSGAAVIVIDRDADAIDGESAENLAIEVDAEGAAYLVYTSGSTGRPKGVVVPHRVLSMLVRWQVERWADRAPARTLQFSSPSFDVFLQETFATWAAGGALVLVDEWTRRDPAALLDLLRERKVERLFLPFAALQAIAEGAREAWLPALREVVTAGEALRATPQLSAFFRAHAGARLENQYGPSETHVVTAHTLAADVDAWPALPPIGKPVDGARLYVLDAGLRPVPAGAPGELYAGGSCVGRGYRARFALTAERFVPDPFSSVPGARMYRTGDRARWTDGGELEFLGRADEQVKVRGFRVEPGEVEAALALHPSVRAAVVAARGEGAGRRLVAWVIAAEGAEVRSDELRDFLRGRLPEFMIPGAFATVDAFPRTPSGKVDRRALPDPEAETAAFVAPRTETEIALAKIWSGLLSVETVGAADSFFALGGHSLLATRLASAVRTTLEIEVPLRTLFEAPILADQAARIDAIRAAALAALVDELEGISDDEARALLASEEAQIRA